MVEEDKELAAMFQVLLRSWKEVEATRKSALEAARVAPGGRGVSPHGCTLFPRSFRDLPRGHSPAHVFDTDHKFCVANDDGRLAEKKDANLCTQAFLSRARTSGGVNSIHSLSQANNNGIFHSYICREDKEGLG